MAFAGLALPICPPHPEGLTRASHYPFTPSCRERPCSHFTQEPRRSDPTLSIGETATHHRPTHHRHDDVHPAASRHEEGRALDSFLADDVPVAAIRLHDTVGAMPMADPPLSKCELPFIASSAAASLPIYPTTPWPSPSSRITHLPLVVTAHCFYLTRV